MVERAPFLTAAYSAYHHRAMPEDDTEMTRVGPDTPGGERHGLEHLTSTDRGIIMMRNMLRRGIRAVSAGQDLDYRILTNGAAVPTYSHDRVIPGIAPADTKQADRQLLREVARNVVAETVRHGLEG
jgi:hypothetical protein